MIPDLSVWYDMLEASGVDAEWCSIGTVIFASLLVFALLRFVFRICFGARK